MMKERRVARMGSIVFCVEREVLWEKEMMRERKSGSQWLHIWLCWVVEWKMESR